MADIIDNEENDKDTVEEEILEQQFNQKYELICEKAAKTYINKLTCTRSLKLALTQSDNTIEVYELSNTSLSRVCRLSGHQKTIGELVFSPKEDHLLYSAGLDGAVKLWDTRTSGSCAQEYKDESEPVRPYECLSVCPRGRALCAGTQLVEDDAFLVFWDARKPQPLGGYWNSHTDDITQVKFHSDKSSILTSGSLDGLVNVYNIAEATEDDALTYSLNVENSVERLSWLDERTVACITQAQELQVLDVVDGDLGNKYSRDKVAKSIKRSRGDDCYLVDAFAAADGAAALLAGSYAHDGSVLRSVSLAEHKLQPRTDFAANTQTVRCSWYDRERDLLLTAGEGGRVHVWRGGAAGGARAPAAPAHAHRKARAHRHAPY